MLKKTVLVLIVLIFTFSYGSDKKNIAKNYTLDDLAIAIINNDKKEIKKILKNLKLDLNHPITEGKRAIHFAVRYSDLKTVKLLVKKGAKIDIKDNKERTPLHIAARWNKYEIAKYLLLKGLDPNATTRLKSTPLHIAVFYSDFKLVKLLVDKGCRINIKDKYGNTPLHWAVTRSKNRDKYLIVNYLLKKGADPYIKNLSGKTPFEMAIDQNDTQLLKIFLSR